MCIQSRLSRLFTIIVLVAALSTTASGLPPQAPELMECHEILEELYGEPFENCLPGSTTHCLTTGGVTMACADASFDVAFVGDRRSIYSDCPNGVGEPTPPGSITIRCWLLSQSGWGWLRLGTGTVSTDGYIVQECIIPAGLSRECFNPEISEYLETTTTLQGYCGDAVTVTKGASGSRSFISPLSCAEA